MAVYFGLILARVGVFVAIMPIFATRTPRTIRAALALVLTVFYFAAVSPEWDPAIARQSIDIHWLTYALALIRESLIGAAMGLAFSLFMLPARVAGEFISQQIGLAVATPSATPGETPTGTYTAVFETIAALVFLEFNGHYVVLGALHASFDKLPLGGSSIPKPVAPMLSGLAGAHQMGVMLAGPLGLCLFLLAVVLAIMARSAPQLNIYTIGFTLQVALALLGALFLMPDMVKLMIAIFARNEASLPGWFG